MEEQLLADLDTMSARTCSPRSSGWPLDRKGLALLTNPDSPSQIRAHQLTGNPVLGYESKRIWEANFRAERLRPATLCRPILHEINVPELRPQQALQRNLVDTLTHHMIFDHVRRIVFVPYATHSPRQRREPLHQLASRNAPSQVERALCPAIQPAPSGVPERILKGYESATWRDAIHEA